MPSHNQKLLISPLCASFPIVRKVCRAVTDHLFTRSSDFNTFFQSLNCILMISEKKSAVTLFRYIGLFRENTIQTYMTSLRSSLRSIYKEGENRMMHPVPIVPKNHRRACSFHERYSRVGSSNAINFWL